MLSGAKTLSGFAVNDIAGAKDFYGDKLGLDISVMDETNGLMSLKSGDGRETLVYRKEDLVPANYTILNFEVDDIDEAVQGLASRGIQFETYDAFEHDEKGIVRGIAAKMGPDIAWFKDPSGNILSVLQNP